MIAEETVVEIRRLYYGEHFTVGTIASLLGVHHETVERAIGTERFHGPRPAERASADAVVLAEGSGGRRNGPDC